MSDFLAFRRMITPAIIQVLFWIGVSVSVIAGLTTMTSGVMGVFTGLALIVIGPLAVRIYCELLILLFRMNETLSDIRSSLVPSAR
ncbi:MAG TPA: DUF4282 domain-containing protein [Terriglobia bacterium]|nr:DUF4282 domain-containing protein [Terriglobia bacterium]